MCRIKCNSRWLVTPCLIMAASVSSRATEQPFSVCEVLRNPGHYRSNVIAIRGILFQNKRHGWFIQDAIGNEPCEGNRKQGQLWPPAIAVTQYTLGSDLEDGPATFESDTQRIRAALREAEKQVSADPSRAIQVTLVGELRVRTGIRISRTAEGWYEGTGYAQSGQYPALLVLKSVLDVKLISKSALSGR